MLNFTKNKLPAAIDVKPGLSKSKSAEEGRIHTLDGFRGIFALLIILDHADNGSYIFQNFIVKNSDYFVDYFFVLSGFVISYNYADKIISFERFKDFMKKRLIRLYPLLLFSTLLYFGFVLIGTHSGSSTDPYKVLFFHLFDTLTLMNSNPVFGSTLGMNYPSWSISSEIISYMLFGFCLFAFNRKPIVILSVFFLGAATFIIYTGKYLYMGDFGFIRGLFCFILGYYVFLLSRRVKLRKSNTVTELLFISILLLAFRYLPKSGAIMLPLIFAIGIFLFIRSKGIITHFLETRAIQFLGKISYSVYLNHALVVYIVKIALFDILKLNNSSIVNNVAYLSLAIIVTIVYSYFTNRYIETYVGKLLKERFIKRRKTDPNVELALAIESPKTGIV